MKKSAVGKNLIIFLIILGFIVFILNFISSAESKPTYNLSNPSTWAPNLDKLREDLTDETKVKNINEALQKLSSSQRIYIFEKIKASLGNVPSQAKLTGFGSQNLKFYKLDAEKERGKLWVGDGYSWLDFSNLPPGTSSVKYIEGTSADNKRGKFIFSQKNGGEISIENGWVEGNKLFYGKSLLYKLKSGEVSYEMKSGEFLLSGTGDKIFFDRDGRINLEGKAGIKIDGKTFSRNDMVLGTDYDNSKAYIISTSDNEFKASNIKIASDNTVIRTFKGIETDVFLKSGDFKSKSQYVQVYENNINLVGKGIEVEAIKEYKDAKGNLLRYNIDLNGEELYFRNGAYLVKTFGKQTIISRIINEKDETGAIKKTFPVLIYNLQDTTEGIQDDGDFKGIKTITPQGESWVKMSELTKTKDTVLGIYEVVKITTGFDSSYRDLPDDLPNSPEKFKETMISIPKKIEIEAKLQLGSVAQWKSGHTEFLNGKDLYDSFFHVNEGSDDETPDGTIESFRKQGFTFTDSELGALKSVFSSALDYDPATPKEVGKVFPGKSRIFINIGENTKTASIETWINNKGKIERTSTPLTKLDSLGAIKKYSSYSILAEDPEMPGYDPANGIKTPLDRLKKEFPNRKNCPDCFKY